MDELRFTPPPKTKNFTRYAWGLLFYCLATILWGATVRATGSGDGCGSNWPLCGKDGGALFPHGGNVATFIEHTHRFTSELIGLFVVGLVVWAYRVFGKGHPVRRSVLLAFLFTVTEALLGMWLVKSGLVAHNASPLRGVAMSLHLVNTLLLVGSLTLTAWQSTHSEPIRWNGRGPIGLALGVGIALVIVLCVSGAISALGGTLFPVRNLAEGLKLDLSPTSHVLIRLRFYHPFIAISVGLYTLFLARLVLQARFSPEARMYARGLAWGFGFQLAFGLSNLILHAPLVMQLIHLLIADLLWINMILLTASTLSQTGTALVNVLPERGAGTPQTGAPVNV